MEVNSLEIMQEDFLIHLFAYRLSLTHGYKSGVLSAQVIPYFIAKK